MNRHHKKLSKRCYGCQNPQDTMAGHSSECTIEHGHKGCVWASQAIPEHPEELTKRCRTCAGIHIGSFHEGCTVEHGHKGCKWEDLKMAPPLFEVNDERLKPGVIVPGKKIAPSFLPGVIVQNFRQAPQASAFLDELTQRKIIILWEIEPNSDRFQQVMLTEEGAGRVQFTLELQMVRPPGIPEGNFIVVTNPEHSVKLKDIRDCYTIEQIIEQMRKGPDVTKP